MAVEPSDPSRGAELRRAIATAQSEAVVDGLRRCAERFRHRAWLDRDAECLTRPGQFLKSANPEELDENKEDLADFAAASALLHCTDAWTLLGNATLCLLSGALSQAVHLVYYSELRSALSLMNATGVLVVNDAAAAVGVNAVSKIRPGPSHELLWQIFAEWSASHEAQESIGAMLTFHKVPMSRWAAIAQKGGSGAPVVAELLRRWGVDLKNIGSDRDARNLASYNPSYLYEEVVPNFGRWARNTAASVAAYLEPSSNAGFPSLDNALFSTVLTTLVGDFEDQTRRILLDVYGNEFNANRVLDLILKLRSSGPTLIDKATRTVDSNAVTLETVESMLGRALILARLATGLSFRLQRQAGIDLDEFSWWSNEVAVRQGFWLPPDRPESLQDMWADLELGVSDLHSVSFGQPTGPFEVHNSASYGMVAATGLARAAVWSLSA